MKQRIKTLLNKFNSKSKKIAVITLAAVLSLTLVVATFAWYYKQVSLSGSTFVTGTVDFIATGYNDRGEHVTTILQDGKPSDDQNVNKPLFMHNEWEAGVTHTAYIVVEKLGSLPMDYKITFSAAGDIEYLGGFWYSLTDITSIMPDVADEDKLVQYISDDHPPCSESEGNSMATMDRYATRGTIDNDGVNKRYYRLDYGMKASAITTDYTDKTIEIIPEIYVTQVGALDDDEGYGYIYDCSSYKDIEYARDNSLPGDSIRLLKSINFEGDLVFNKPINIITNNFVLEISGNLIYDYTSAKTLTLNVTGNGAIKVISPVEGVGGNITISAPLGDVILIGSNNAAGDIQLSNKITVSGTRAYGAAGVTFNRVKIIDSETESDETVYVLSDTKITVLENTNLVRVEAVAQANNIEIQNAGTIQTVALSAMNVLPQTSSPQIYITNMGYIVQPIELPEWSEKFISSGTDPVTYSGNTRIVQTITGNSMAISCSGNYSAEDIELESVEITVAPINKSNGELVVYYQDIEIDGEVIETTIESLLTKYFEEQGSVPSIAISQIRRLDIVSIGDKAIVNSDIEFLNSNLMPSLMHLDMSRANIYDTEEDKPNRLYSYAFENVTKIKTLVLPNNLVEIGDYAMSGMNCPNIITIPGSVASYGLNWFSGNNYVSFAASIPLLSAVNRLDDIKAIFVEEYYVDSYKGVYRDYVNKVFPLASKDDEELHFVRKLTGTNDWEIVYYIGNESTNINVGDGLYVDRTPINVTSVGANSYAAALANVQAVLEFSDSIKEIGSGAFKNTNVIRVDSWGDSLEIIGESAFEGCENINDTVVLPDSLRTIEKAAFKGCKGITGINTGGAQVVNGSAFYGCTALVWAELPSATTLSQTTGGTTDGIFYGNTNLVSVKLPSLMQTEGIVFNGSSSLTEVIFGDSMFTEVAVAGNDMFEGTFSKVKLYFDMNDVSGIGSVSGMTNVIYPKGEKMGVKLVNNKYDVGMYIVSDTISGDGTVTLITTNNDTFRNTVEIPGEWDGKPITRIYDGAFRNSGFSNVTLSFPDSITHIGDDAFNNKLTGIKGVSHWSENLVYIGKSAFQGTGIAERVELPDNALQRIDNSAFSGCKSITYVNTGSAQELGISVFNGCTKLVEAELPNVESVGDGTSAANDLFSGCSSLVCARIPELTSVQSTGMFTKCTNLRELYMESAEPTLGSFPFNNISSVKSIRIYVPVELVDTYKGTNLSSDLNNKPTENIVYPNDCIKAGTKLVSEYNIGEYIIRPEGDGTATVITSTLSYSGTVLLPNTVIAEDGNEYRIVKIGDYAFSNNTFSTGTSLKMGEYVTEIGTRSFTSLTGIANLDLNNTIIVGDHAFNGCKNVKTLVANKLEQVGKYSFNSCSSLVTFNLPKLNTASDYSFGSCTKLTTANIPELTSVSYRMFYKCSALTSVYLEEVTSFDSSAFNSCSALKEIIINRVIASADQLPSGATAIPTTNCTVKVPYVCLSYYTADVNWKTRKIVSFDKVFTDASSNKYILKVNGTESSVHLFFGNGNVSSVAIPATMAVDGVTYTVAGLEYGAFESAASTLTEVTLPAGLYKFGSKALTEATSLTAIHVDPANRFYASDDNGVMHNKDFGMLIKYPCGKADESYTVIDDVVAIGEYAFCGTQHLKNVVISPYVAVIDSTSFSDCVLSSVQFMGDEPPLLMGTQVFDTTDTGFVMIVPDGTSDAYVRSMNFAVYAPYISDGGTVGVDIPADGDMNTIPAFFRSDATVFAALPPERRDEDPDSDDDPEPDPDNETEPETDSDPVSDPVSDSVPAILPEESTGTIYVPISELVIESDPETE